MKMIRNYLIAGAVLASGVAVIQSARVIGQDKQPIPARLEAAPLHGETAPDVIATPATRPALAATGSPSGLTAPPTLAFTDDPLPGLPQPVGSVNNLTLPLGVAPSATQPAATRHFGPAMINLNESNDVLYLSRGQEVPEDENLETWVSTTLSAYANSEDETYRKQSRDEIGKALEKIFQIRQDRQMEDLKALEARVQKLRVNLETRDKSKADILAHRLDSLLREADGIGWGDGIPAPKRSLPTAALGIPVKTFPPRSQDYLQPRRR